MDTTINSANVASNSGSSVTTSNLPMSSSIDVGGIIEEIKDSTPEKPWWTSKVILINLGVLIAAGTSYFGFDLKEKGIDVKTIIELLSIALPMVNIYLRSRSNGKTQPIQKVFVPPVVSGAVARAFSTVNTRVFKR